MVAGFSGCANDDNPVAPSKEGAVTFSATVPAAPRAEPTTTATISSFRVYAFTNGKPYMDDVKVLRKGAEWVYSPVMYWPDTPVNFYAFTPEVSTPPTVEDNAVTSLKNYVNDGTVDLLYAVNMDEMAKATPVNFNFRHALSNVIVNLSSANEALSVKVEYVTINNLARQGTFNFPQATTAADKPENAGTWTDLGLTGTAMLYYFDIHDEALTLTPEPVNVAKGNLETSFMIPQELQKPAYDGTNYFGNYIEVDCEIFDSATGNKIWPTSSTPSSQLVPETRCGRLIYPVTSSVISEWKAGYAYVYNITIDNPVVLEPINFNVTVDEYQQF